MSAVNNDQRTKWIKSEYLLQAINLKMNTVHEAKVGKEFTPEQETRLRTLRGRSRVIGNFRFKLIRLESKHNNRHPLFN